MNVQVSDGFDDELGDAESDDLMSEIATAVTEPFNSKDDIDKTVGMIKPGSAMEQKLGDFLVQKNQKIIEASKRQMREEEFI